jgi:hemerythrin-like domain-containing protein
MYERHIRIEDNVIFPLAARLLTEQDKSAIADEMAGRRKVKLVGIGDGSHGL